MDYHFDTGCMSQYMVVPQANSSPLNIATMATDGWFPGAIGKVAIYKLPADTGPDQQSLQKR